MVYCARRSQVPSEVLGEPGVSCSRLLAGDCLGKLVQDCASVFMESIVRSNRTLIAVMRFEGCELSSLEVK